MTGNKKTLLTKLSTFCMCFFSLFSVGAAALAWFCCNKSVNGGASVAPKIEDLHADYFVYKYNKDNEGTDIDENAPVANTKLQIDGFTLNTYDTIFTYSNKFTPALIRIHLYGRDLPSVPSGGSQSITVKINRDTSFVDEHAQDPEVLTTYKCITSVADFTAREAINYSSYIEDDNLDQISDIDKFFEDVDTYFKSSSDTRVNFDNGDGTKPASIGLETTYSNVVSQNGINHAIIYVYVDYNLDLIENFTGNAGESLGSSDFLTAMDVVLANDLTSISVELSNN
mgnify:CR=1 FL=1